MEPLGANSGFPPTPLSRSFTCSLGAAGWGTAGAPALGEPAPGAGVAGVDAAAAPAGSRAPASNNASVARRESAVEQGTVVGLGASLRFMYWRTSVVMAWPR